MSTVEAYLKQACAQERAMTIRQSVARWVVLYRPPSIQQTIETLTPKKYGLGCRTSVYLGVEVLDEMTREANRQGIPLSALVQQAWLVAESELKRFDGPQIP